VSKYFELAGLTGYAVGNAGYVNFNSKIPDNKHYVLMQQKPITTLTVYDKEKDQRGLISVKADITVIELQEKVKEALETDREVMLHTSCNIKLSNRSSIHYLLQHKLTISVTYLPPQ